MVIKSWLKWSRLVIAMLAVQAIATGMQLLTRLILIQGTFIFALMTYRHVIAAIFVAPLAFYFERGQVKRFGWSVWLWLFLNALTGITFAMGMFFYGLRDTTATYATNFLNLIPIVTFLFSTIMGIEELKLKTRAGKVKSFGALLCLAGALTTSLYSGHQFHIGHSHKSPVAAKFSSSHWGRGTFFLVGSCISYSVWFIVQVKLQKVFPFKYTATMLTCIIACIQSLVMGLCLNPHKAAWKLGFNLQLITIVYSGSLATAATFCLILWAIAKQGPTYPSMFNPLTLIFVAVSEAFLLGEALRVGTLIGMVLIISGIYSFLWGKGKEHKAVSLDEPRKTSIEPQSSATVAPSSSPIKDNVVISHVDDQ